MLSSPITPEQEVEWGDRVLFKQPVPEIAVKAGEIGILIKSGAIAGPDVDNYVVGELQKLRRITTLVDAYRRNFCQ